MAEKNPFRRIFAVLDKDLRSEFRTRYAISAVLLFILTTVSMIIFSLAGEKVNSEIATALLWILMFFSGMTGLSKSFVSEEERGTSFLLQISIPSYAVFFGKLLFNIILVAALNILSVILFFLFFDYLTLKEPLTFAGIILIGSLGFASATTIISAIISKAGTRSALFPALSFPVLLPLILLGIQITKFGFDGGIGYSPGNDLRMIIAYSGLMITGSFFLFDFIWKD